MTSMIMLITDDIDINDDDSFDNEIDDSNKSDVNNNDNDVASDVDIDEGDDNYDDSDDIDIAEGDLKMNTSLFFFLAKMANFGHFVKAILRQID